MDSEGRDPRKILALGARGTAGWAVAGSARALSAATREALRRRAERLGVAEESIVALALETLFATYDGDEELARAIRCDRLASGLHVPPLRAEG